MVARIGVQTKFFDNRVLRAADKAQRRQFFKFGGFVRTTSKCSIRKRKRKSRPGQAPTSRTGLLKRFIFFEVNEIEKSVTIGPVLLARASPRVRTSGTIPRLIEEGGTGRILNKGRKAEMARWKARPYMGPAFRKGLDAVPGVFEDTIRR